MKMFTRRMKATLLQTKQEAGQSGTECLLVNHMHASQI